MKITTKNQFRTDGNYCFYSLTIWTFTLRLFQACVQLKVYRLFSYSKSEFSIFSHLEMKLKWLGKVFQEAVELMSSSISMTIKSTRKMNFPTLMSTSSGTPFGCAIVLSTICKVIVMGVRSPKLSLLTTNKGIKLMLASESHNAFLNSKFSMVQGMVKLPGSCIFFGKLLWITTLHVVVKFTTHFLGKFLFLLRMSLKNLA